MPNQNQNPLLPQTPKGVGSFNISPSWEEGLSIIPQLLGAYEAARGRPIGAFLQTGGDLLNQHAGYRTSLQNIGAQVQQIQSMLGPTTPGAQQLFNSLQPQLGTYSPDEAQRHLDEVEAYAKSEQLQAEKQHNRGIQHVVTKSGAAVSFDPNTGTYLNPWTKKPLTQQEWQQMQQGPGGPKSNYQAFVAAQAAKGITPDNPQYWQNYHQELAQEAQAREKPLSRVAAEAQVRMQARMSMPVRLVSPNTSVLDSNLRDVTDRVTFADIVKNQNLHSVTKDTKTQIDSSTTLYHMLNEINKEAARTVPGPGGLKEGAWRVYKQFVQPGYLAPLNIDAQVTTEGTLKFITKNRPANDQMKRLLEQLNNVRYGSADYQRATSDLQKFLVTNTRSLVNSNNGVSDLGRAMAGLPDTGGEESGAPTTEAPAPTEEDKGEISPDSGSDSTDD